MSDDVQGQTEAPEHDSKPGASGASAAVMDNSRRKPLLIGLAVAVVVLGIVYLGYHLLIGSRSVSTDNAYVAGENAQITPLTQGQVVEVAVVNTQPVRKGQLLMRLDDADQKIAVAEAEANLAMAQRRYTQSRAQGSAAGASATAKEAAIPEAQARLVSAQANLAKARTDYQRRASLDGSGAVSGEELTSARNALAAAQASVSQAQAGLSQARADAVSARQEETASRAATQGLAVNEAPEVRAAMARLANARLDLARTVIRAPIDGVIAQRTVQVGQRVTNATVAMVVVPVEQLYVDANFKEDQLGKVRSGQAVEVTSDFYGDDVVYHGKVVGFSGGTGAAFALIPAQNATGNWIKVVQRLPVRIQLDPRELREHPLRVGLSMEATIDLTSGGR
ncbi:membrane fusion protein (multidrug efflux system) [Novosphingobium chloroacetimidivorans]|uniref:Membrane fusion protein (Multidrug efflux system) n=1 Tax=Novosphingobium chloroacetimidivorans TaxID=1428314 RepID=A0A7W7NVN9_9SPHN|nr:HlyD family efflux transporter periplasmic adaptor subunit [Novosphingobium chloroacetimidivorans]MBB4858486.1 membrane fusion protein (multidrug efflux system) [Novosphingobium chloroacetimidivorans]